MHESMQLVEKLKQQQQQQQQQHQHYNNQRQLSPPPPPTYVSSSANMIANTKLRLINSLPAAMNLAVNGGEQQQQHIVATIERNGRSKIDILFDQDKKIHRKNLV